MSRGMRYTLVFLLVFVCSVVCAMSVVFFLKPELHKKRILKHFPMVQFGVDLRGGTSMTLKIDIKHFMTEKYESLIDPVKDALWKGDVKYSAIKADEHGITLVSRDFGEIVCEVEALSKNGYKEIMLLGQNVNSYGKDLKSKKVSFANLLTRLNKIKGIKKISFMTSNPWDLTDDKIDKYFHLPVQSGSNEILKKMNRKYTSKDYLKLVSKIRKRIPEIKIGTDIIVGFPGETEKQFKETVSLVKSIGFVKAYISRYSPRSGTTASFLKDDVSPSEKRRRWKLLNELINKKSPILHIF